MKNLSVADKLIRVSIALLLIYLAHFSAYELGYFYALAIIGYGYMLLTSLFSFCYIYYPLNFTTYRTKPKITKDL